MTSRNSRGFYFDEKVVLITGAATGIGRAVAAAFASYAKGSRCSPTRPGRVEPMMMLSLSAMTLPLRSYALAARMVLESCGYVPR
jgi:NAD(P)-dependent dehydrogenase (short-subunit alcohol dehydrogenase family)